MGKGVDQPFVLQFLERQAQRRARDTELCGQWNLGDSLARPERAEEQHFPQTERRARHLRCAVARRIHFYG